MTALGAEGRRFESCLPDHKTTDFCGFAADAESDTSAPDGTDRIQAESAGTINPGIVTEHVRESFPSTLTFAQLAGMLFEQYRIPSSEFTKFTSRIQNFFRHGFVKETRAGKGKRALFSREAVLKLIVALELTQAGMRPEFIVGAFVTHDDKLAPIWAGIDCPGFLIFLPSALADEMSFSTDISTALTSRAVIINLRSIWAWPIMRCFTGAVS